MAVTESELREAFREWTDPLPPAVDRIGAVERRIRRHRNRVRAAGAAALCLVVAVGAILATRPSASPDGGPPVRRGPSHPALVFPDVYAGSLVAGQVAGNGVQTRSTTLVWPATGLSLATQCSTPGGGFTISVTGDGGQHLGTPCVAGSVNMLDDAGQFFGTVGAGTRVTMTVSTDAPMSGAWSVAVLQRDQHWLPGWTQPLAFHGLMLQHWASGGVTTSVSYRPAAGERHPVFVVSCGQPGRLSVYVNGSEAAVVQCPDLAWSQQELALSAETLSSLGYLPGRTLTISFGWSGGSWAYVGVAQYG